MGDPCERQNQGVDENQNKENRQPLSTDYPKDGSQKEATKPKRRLHPKGYYHGPVGFSMPLYPLKTPARLRGMLAKDTEGVRRKSLSAEDIFVLTGKPKEKPKTTTESTPILMWGEEEDDDNLECDCFKGCKKRDPRRQRRGPLKSAAAAAEAPLLKAVARRSADTMETPRHEGPLEEAGEASDGGYETAADAWL